MRLRLAAVPGVLLIAVAAAMWGTDPIIRKTMSFSTSATTIVFGEHAILVVRPRRFGDRPRPTPDAEQPKRVSRRKG